MTVWHSIGHQSSCRRVREGLCAVTQVAALHIFRYIAAHAQPPEVVCYQVRLSSIAGVTHDWRVVEGRHYVVSELTIRGDVDSTLIGVPGHPFSPSSQCKPLPSVQLFQGSNNRIFPVSAVMDPFQELSSLPSRVTWEGKSHLCLPLWID